MKSLQESLENELVCGKHLFEKLKIRKSTNKTISIPVISINDGVIYKNKEWKEITLPKEKYVIYVDKYRRNIPHLGYIDELLFNMMQFQDDFEDFDINKDILFASDDEQEIAEWYIQDYLKLDLPENDVDTADWYNQNFGKSKHKIYDNLSFIHDLYLGYEHIDDELILDKTNIETLINSFNDFLGYDVK